jgi:tetrahydromethanopterin S-methyltransferase subunit G
VANYSSAHYCTTYQKQYYSIAYYCPDSIDNVLNDTLNGMFYTGAVKTVKHVVGAIIGAVVGVIVFIIIMIVICCYFCCKKKTNQTILNPPVVANQSPNIA